MIGLVIVSHSAKLAEGVCELVNQMTQGRLPLAAAGGLDDPDNPIGTDAFRVQEAIESVYSDDGVVVLMDLGSALLSAETALEFLTEEQQAHIRLCEAPLVEGAVAAAVQALNTTDIDLVMAEARGALTAKAAQLKGVVAEVSQPAPAVIVSSADEMFLTVRNAHGLHARPAAQFVSTAARFQADITVRNVTEGRGPVNAKSINQVTTLGVRQGQKIGISAVGQDAAAALTALEKLAAANFGEAEEAPVKKSSKPQVIPAQAPQEGRLTGIAASPGIALGPVALYRLAAIKVSEQQVDDPQAEWERLLAAIQAAKQEIKTVQAQATAQVGDYEAAIFAAHQLFLADPALVDVARQQIFDRSINAEAAWQAAIETQVAGYQALEDAYLQARAADVADVGQRVLKWLTGVIPTQLDLTEPSILVATDLSPSDTAQLDPTKVLGICTEQGTATAHSAILARALGIPAVVGLGPQLATLSAGTLLGLDGQKGLVWVDPDSAQVTGLESQRADWLAAQQAAQVAGRQPAITRDGKQIEVVANIGSLAEVQAALDNGAEGVGLLRTEFLYLERSTAPTETEQLTIYGAIAKKLGSRPLIIRTLDIGGDKPLPYLDLGPEANPFLGWRGIRYCLDHPDLLKTQLRAILQASPGHQLKIMFPMVSSLAEVRAAKGLLAECQAELRQAGISFDEGLQIGIMIEVPAAVAIADQLAAEVDFFSIGTNDLSQYTTAADRTNARVSALADTFQPAVLRLIRQTIAAAHAAGIWVGLCGEFAGNPLATPLLLGFGLDEFSMSGPAIPLIKQAIGQLALDEAKLVAEAALQLDSAEAVRHYLETLSAA